MFLRFDLSSPEQRQKVRKIIDVLDGDEQAAPNPASSNGGAAPVDDRILRKLPKLLRLGSGELLALAVQHFGPDEQFDMKQLAAGSGLDLETLLSKNRTFALSCDRRHLQKEWILRPHGGSPRKFSVPAAIHAEVARLVALQGDADAAPAQAAAQ